MRAATVVAASIIAIGIYLSIAAIVDLTATWIGLGILAISLTAALSLVMTDPTTRRRVA